MPEPGTLIKFGNQENIKQLQNEGLLYLNNLPYFWGIEDEELRGDPFDSVAEVSRGPKVVFPTPDGKEVTLEGEWVMRFHPSEPEKINIYCMYALRPSAGSFPVHEKNYRFGDSALVLTNPQEFMKRVETTLKEQAIRGKADLVTYIDNNHIGKVGPFKKLNAFSYQSEWRLVCLDGPGKERKIRIGNIQDISVILRSEEVNNEIKIEPESGKEEGL